MELDEALDRIADIRSQLSHTETFRGFRALTVGCSSLLGFAAALIQAERIAEPLEQVSEYVALWTTVALLCVGIVGAELAYRWTMTESLLKRRLTILAVQQFVPCLFVGAALTAIIVCHAPASVGLLPGLWALVFSLGVFACCRLLPPVMSWVGLYYMASGSVALLLGTGSQALSPWLMVGTFGCGQLLAAAMLYYTLERHHEPTA